MNPRKSGLLLIDKPAGISSAAVVAKVRKKHGIDKIGHGGTLDPFASGLLVLLVGEGTKIARFLLEGGKVYEAEACTLFETDTEDRTGQRLSPNDSPAISSQELRATLSRFLGSISQIPPRFSALKKDGVPFYERARRGETLEPAPRQVEIHSLEILAATPSSFRFRVSCGGGTYIRSLARDWARAAGGVAHLAELRRLESNQFRVTEALSLDAALEASLLPLVSIEDALRHLPQIHSNPDLTEKVRRGHPAACPALKALWTGSRGYALVRNEQGPVAVVNFPPESPEVSLERVFDPAAL